MQLNRMGAWVSLVLASTAGAQHFAHPLDWVEGKVPPAPSYTTESLIPVDMPLYVSLKIGVDPATVSVGDDGVVRYVVVMRNAAGSVNAAYEGVRCATDEVKTYARSSGAGGWTNVSDPQWKSLTDNMPSRHAHAITRQGACSGLVASNLEDTLAALKQKTRPAR
jgi:hypothetical protein